MFYVNKNMLLIQSVYGIAATLILRKTLITVLQYKASPFLFFLIVEKNSTKSFFFEII